MALKTMKWHENTWSIILKWKIQYAKLYVQHDDSFVQKWAKISA